MFRNVPGVQEGTWCSGRISGVQEGYLVFRKGIWCSGKISGVNPIPAGVLENQDTLGGSI